MHADQASLRWQVANWGGGWIYAPDYLPTGEALFADRGRLELRQLQRPEDGPADPGIPTQQSGTGPLYDYEDYAMQQLPVILPAANPTRSRPMSTHVGGVVFNPLVTLTPEYWYRTQ